MTAHTSMLGNLSNWWQNRIIRTKILIGIFIGVFIYQTISTTYQMQKVENDLLISYKEKALNLSVAVDCIMLKDGILFFNLLDRIGRTEVVGIKIDDNHPSCVERTSFLERLKSTHFKEFKQNSGKKSSEGQAIVSNEEAESEQEQIEEIEEIDFVEEVAPDLVPLGLVFDLEVIKGEMEETSIQIEGEQKIQLLYSVRVNGVEITFDLTDLPDRKLDRFLTLFLTAVGNLLVLFIIIWMMSGQIVEPLKRLTDFTQGVIMSEVIEKGEKVDLVQTRAMDETGILTRAFNQMIGQLQKSYRQIIKSRAAIGDLLDNTGQGFFSFGPDYLIHDEHSKACQQFFQLEIAGMDALDLMVSEKKKDVKELTDLLFNGVGDLALLEDLLPNELGLNSRILAVEYRFIPSISNEITDKMMVILTDVTQERELARQLEKDEVINELIVRIARDKEGFIQFIQDTDTLFQRLKEDLDSGYPSDHNTLMRHFHTIKGVAGSYGLKDLSEKAHELEGRLQNDCKDPDDLKRLGEEFREMRGVLRSSLDHIQDIISWKEIEQSRSRVYKVPEEKVRHLERLFDHTRKVRFKEVHRAISDLKKQPIQPVFSKFAVTASNLAEKLGKIVSVVIKGGEVEVSYERMGPLFDAMIHLVRNSVDHGIENPEVRIAESKQETGSLVLEAMQENGEITLSISDDGAGIDAEVIKKIAFKKGLVSEPELEKLSPEQALKLIFEPGFSTVDNVSAISGRGVGMDAVKTVLKSLDGTIAIKTKRGRGTSFILTLPDV